MVFIATGDSHSPAFIICGDWISNEDVKPSKLFCHTETKYCALKDYTLEFWKRKKKKKKTKTQVTCIMDYLLATVLPQPCLQFVSVLLLPPLWLSLELPSPPFCKFHGLWNSKMKKTCLKLLSWLGIHTSLHGSSLSLNKQSHLDIGFGGTLCRWQAT